MSENKILNDYSTFLIEKASNLNDFQLEWIIEIERTCKLSKWSRQDYRDESNRKNSLFLIARKTIPKPAENTEIVGFILFRVNGMDETKKNAGSICIEADLLNFGVAEKFQKQGIGNALFVQSQLRLSDLKAASIWLEVRESNIYAIRFYEKKGFRIIQIRKNFYSQPIENALLMKLEM